MQTLVFDLPVVFLNPGAMFLRAHKRLKDGKTHCYWSIVENRRVQGDRVVQRQVLYLGEINDSQRAAWCRTIEVFDEDEDKSTQLAIFPEDREAPDLTCEVVQIRLSDLQLHHPTPMGCLLAGLPVMGSVGTG